MENRTWGKVEVEKLIQDQRKQGNYQIAMEIKKSIKDQDKELVKYEAQFVNYSIMIVTALAGYIARRATAKFLEEHFA